MMTSHTRASRGTSNLSAADLERRLEALIANLGDRDADDEQRALLLDLQVHQIELEMQGRELREARGALEESRDRYARLFDLAPVGYAVFDPHGVILDANLTAARMLGRPRSSLIGSPFSRYLEVGERRPFLSHVEQVLEARATDPENMSLMMRLRPGPEAAGGDRVFQLLSAPRFGDSGEECFSALLDVTAQYEAQAKQHASDHLRQVVLDVLPEQIAVLDGTGKIIAVNRAWADFAADNGASDTLQSGVGLDYVAACRSACGDEAESARIVADSIVAVIARRLPSFNQEYPCHTAYRHRWFEFSAVPFGGGMEGAVIVHRDITERKLAEDHSRRARESAAQGARVNAVGMLAASLIHELTQPLSAASFFGGTALTLFEQGSNDRDKLRQVLTGVEEQINRAGDILQRLRDFLRRREMQMRPVAIDELIAKATALVRWYAADKKVRVHLTHPAPSLVVMVDALQVEQVLVNLLCNSIQAIDGAGTERREVSIAIESHRGEIEFVIADTGPGLPADAGERLFDIFTSTKDSGLGMGLAISRDIVGAHGGKLWAEDAASEGAIFRFTLPLQETDQPQ